MKKAEEYLLDKFSLTTAPTTYKQYFTFKELVKLLESYHKREVEYAKFRRKWILDPSKEMIIESEIEEAFKKLKS